MTLKELQKQVDHWITTAGVRYFDPLTNTILLMEEVGEVARIMARTHGEQTPKPDEKYDLEDELADVLFVLTCLANQSNIDLETAMQKNILKKQVRDSDRHLNNKKLM